MLAIPQIAKTLKPNSVSLGYGLFLAINAASTWGGVFPFLPLEFQSPQILLWFFASQSLMFSLSFLLSALGIYFVPRFSRLFPVKVIAASYAAGWVFLIAALYLDDYSLALTCAGGACLGVGAVGFYMLWQRLFASCDSDVGDRDLILGTAYGAAMYFVLHLIPVAVTAFLIPLVFLPLFGLVIIIKSRRIDREQPMFQDVPREHPEVYKQAVKDLMRSALCVGTLGFCTGIMRSLAVSAPSVGSLVNMLSMGALLVATLSILLLWQHKNIRLNMMSLYRIVFPLTISGFVLLPFLGDEYSKWLSAVLYALFSVAIALMMIQCAQASRDRGLNPVVIYGIFGGIVYALHDVAFIGASSLTRTTEDHFVFLLVIALVALYVLGFMHFINQGGYHRMLSPTGFATIELLALQDSAGKETGDSKQKTNSTSKSRGKAKESKRAEQDSSLYRDRLAKQAELAKKEHRLSAREAEVMELIARGNSVSRIAESLVVSENTIRTHSRRIYAKLNIHKKQELIDLLEAYEPGAHEDAPLGQIDASSIDSTELNPRE